MRRIRLQEKILPWTEPCSEDLSISELWAKIETRFERVYPGKGRLSIKYLQDHYGSVLDTTETVGNIFDDRTGGAELNATSIVHVVRFPPDREESRNPQSFGSITPDQTSGAVLEIWQPPEYLNASQVGDGYGRPVKRQKLQDTTKSGRFDPDRPFLSRERDCKENPQRRLSPVKQALQPHFTKDPQRPLAPRHPSPYGTPISFSLIDCPNQIPFSSTNQDGIPDSPPGKAFLQSIIDLNDDDTKSESPDLGQNLFDVPLSHAGTPAAGTELSITEAAHDAVPQAANTEALYGKATSQTDLVSVAASAVTDAGLGTKKDAQKERLERKRKREDAKSLGNKDVELERMTEPPEELDSTLQAKEAEDKERQSRADETKEKEKKNDSPEKQKDNIVHGKGQNRVLKANQAEEQDRIAERKADKTQFKEQKTRVPERDIKRLETEQNPKPDGRQDVAKQANGRTMSTRTPGRNGSENVMDRRAEPAVQKAQEPSEPGRPNSSTPLSSSKSEEAKKKSLIAFYPTSGGSRSSSLSIEHSSPIQETPLKGTKTGKQPPLTSALGKSANTLCRSGSSVSWADPIAPSNFSLPAKPAATAPNSNGDKHTSSSPITSADVVASLVRQPSAEIIRSSSASSVGIVPKKSRYPPKKTSANTRKQTKLNVKRDVKQKGRVIDPPSPSKPVVEEALVISSDSDDIVSEFYSEPDDDVQEMSHAKAGPSSKKKTNL
ncbi:MAG: hypothetical protein FRX48_06780 [Lasallia pustulata]|uniref:Nucleolar protein Dnt1-like N-terminal domain-containing protein n=1 Tax=Lasallia pustulata TaxID=136370 RepID=A0A5M8PIR4_9LECA|nr:MAG: hypothetical protein FRX48_06780 [Lasallia pustulata]